MKITLFIVVCCLFFLQNYAQAIHYYVAPNGIDSNPGTRLKPFASIDQARIAVRAIDKALLSDRIIVEFSSGTYELNQPVNFTAEDSGSARYPIEYRAGHGEQVRIVGGKAVTGWNPVANPLAVLSHLAPQAHNHIFQLKLNNLDINNLQGINSAERFSSDPGIELFFCDEPMSLARYPNQGYMLVGDIYDATGAAKLKQVKASKDGAFICNDSRPTRWVDEDNVWLHGFWSKNWSDMRIPMGGVDIETQTIKFPLQKQGQGYSLQKGQHFYAENIFSELDSPSEWFIDRSTSLLYFWPPTSLKSCAAVVSLVRNMFQLNNVSNVTFRGLTVEVGRGSAFLIEGGKNVQVIACTLRNMGKWGVRIKGGSLHRVAGCDVYQTGQGGIYIKGGDRKKLIAAGHCAENNHIHHTARWDPVYQQGIVLLGVGNYAVHNLINNVPHIAIGFSGNEHTIEYNEIHSSVFKANDAGAIYTSPPGETWSMRGNKIRFNYLHDLYGFNKLGCKGIYLDDCFSSALIYGNIFYRVSTSAIFIGGGRDNIITNNMFIDCPLSYYVDARGLGWAKGIEKFARKELEGLRYTKPPWSEHYPNLLGILHDNPLAPKGNIISRNINWGGGGGLITPNAKPYITTKDNIIIKKSKFEAQHPVSFFLSKTSTALSIGFKEIPFDKIGIYKSDERASWPVRIHSEVSW